MLEVWKPVLSHKGLYEVSNKGRVKSLGRSTVNKNGRKVTKLEKILSGGVNVRGYHQVYLYDICGDRSLVTTHRLVAIYFIDNPSDFPIINHKDGNKINNFADNLEWCTPSHNTKHAYDNGLINIKRGTEHHSSKLDIFAILTIKTMLKSKVKGRTLAKHYNTSEAFVSKIKNGKSYEYV
tara:strand:+ start:682 stop:1221 length:540 start_codon:yes stop_codon:yes gene_type:complete